MSSLNNKVSRIHFRTNSDDFRQIYGRFGAISNGEIQDTDASRDVVQTEQIFGDFQVNLRPLMLPNPGKN